MPPRARGAAWLQLSAPPPVAEPPAPRGVPAAPAGEPSGGMGCKRVFVTAAPAVRA
jgi:hypothetical protein